MCGIVGAVSDNNIVPVLINGLLRLEYRGYDSAGMAVLSDNELHLLRKTGRVKALEDAVQSAKLQASLGIAHTRWATHGGVSESNAHPHVSHGQIAVVHNGIIENHDAMRKQLSALGYEFSSQTDTEVIAHSIHYYFQQNANLFEAVRQTTAKLSGAYAIAVIALGLPDEMVVARMGCPLLIAFGDNETFAASDVSAVLSKTRRVMFLEEGDIAQLSRAGIERLIDKTGQDVRRAEQISDVSLSSMELGQYSHYMQKEIHEQPKALSDTSLQILECGFVAELFGDNAAKILPNIKGIKILACGTSYYAGLAGKYWLESIAKLPCDVEIASEYRYREAFVDEDYLVLSISQSGETLDTMEALKYAQNLGHKHSLAICNVKESAIARAAEMVFYTNAGAEIGVASTKAFSTQLVALFGLSVVLGKLRQKVSKNDESQYLSALRCLPGSVQHALNLEPQIKSWAEHFARRNHALFLGRGIHYPIALEGALKLKEISYIHAEAYPAGELKHGPLALVDEQMPVVVIAPNDKLLEKVKSNMQEVAARGGELFVFADLDSHFNESIGVNVIRTPRHVGVLSPIIHVIPVQLLAYHTALLKGTDVDKPRNLAKSVTVE